MTMGNIDNKRTKGIKKIIKNFHNFFKRWTLIHPDKT